jgi:hypothetical protein
MMMMMMMMIMMISALNKSKAGSEQPMQYGASYVYTVTESAL